MDPNDKRPSWVIGWTLDGLKFDCCSNQDPFPFKCEFCAHPTVLCCECDTLFGGLPDTALRSYLNIVHNWQCGNCGERYAEDFLTSGRYRISFDDWIANGLQDFLAVPPMAELLARFVASTKPLGSYLQRGMRGTARGYSFHLVSLAGALEASVVGAADARRQAREIALAGSLADGQAYCDTIADSQLRAFAVVGVADSFDCRGSKGT